MDIIGWLLAVLGLKSEWDIQRRNRRVEIERLNYETAGDISRALDIINLAKPRLLRRCYHICPDCPELCEGIKEVLDEQTKLAFQILDMCEFHKSQLLSGAELKDLDLALSMFQEWRITASRIPPYIQDIVDQYEAILSDENLSSLSIKE
nr:hypothetical protein [uncultured Cohaesibacter sp.]